MGRVVLTGIILFCCLNLSAQIRKGTYSVGYSVGFTSETKSGIMNADYRYSLTDALRISPSVTHFVKDHGYKGWLLDTNLHYVLSSEGGYAVYPLVGMSYSYWDYYDKHTKKYREGKSYWGPNVGLGAELYVLDELVLGLECKYNIIKKHDQLLTTLRIAYYFAY